MAHLRSGFTCSELQSGSGCLCVLDSLNFMSLEREQFDSLGFMDTGPPGLRDGGAARALSALRFYPVIHL